MAEQKQEKKTFKWGEQEYLLDDLLKLHADQENHYYNFARNKGQYDDTSLAGLRSAIASRINAVKEGKAFGADGVLDTDTADNIKIQTQKKGLLKKAKYVDQDNTEWAKYYLNQLVKNLKPYQADKKKDTGGYNEASHNFAAYLTGQGLNAKDVFEKYDKKDENNPDNPRSFAERRALLRQHVQGFRDWRAGKQFDMTKNDNEWDDNLDADLDKFLQDFDTLDNNALTAALRKYGAGDAYTTAFTSDRWDLSKTNEQLAAEQKAAAEKKKKEKEVNDYKQYVKDLHNSFKNSSGLNLGGSTYFTTKGDGLFTMNDDEYQTWLNTHTNDKDAYMANLQKNYLANPFNTDYASEYLTLADRFGGLKEVNIDGKVYKYDPRTIDRQNNRFVAVDPESGEIRHAFIGDIQEEMENLKRKWRINNGYEDEAERYATYNEEGGVLSMQTGGGFNLAQAVNRDLEQRNKAKATENGRSEEQQKALDRVVSNGDDSFTSEKASIGQPDAGFTGADVARLVSIGADITSMFLDPVTGTAVGIGSTLTNFGADIADDGFQWSDVGNLGIGLGLDLVGAIPLFGDAVGTGTKITRNLIKWAPRAMVAMSAYQGVKNFDGMMESWGKITSGDKNQKLTVQDWRNIAQSIGLITGATRAIKNKAAQSSMKRQAKIDDVVGVNVRNKQTGQIEKILVDGDTAKNIKAAQGDKTKIEAELNKLEGYKDKFGADKDFEINTKGGGWQSPWGKTGTAADGSTERGFRSMRKEGRADVTDVYDFSRVQGYSGSTGYQIPGVSNWLNAKHQALINRLNPGLAQHNLRGVITSDAIDAQYKQLLKDQGIDDQVALLQEQMASRTKAQQGRQSRLDAAQTALDAAQAKVQGKPTEAQLTADKAAIESTMAGMPDLNKLNNAQQQVTSLQQKLDALKQQRRTLYSEEAGHVSALQEKGRIASEAIVDANKQLVTATNKQKRMAKAVKTAEAKFKQKYPQKVKRGDPNYKQYQQELRALNKAKAELTAQQQAVTDIQTSIQNNTRINTEAGVNTQKVRSAYQQRHAKLQQQRQALQQQLADPQLQALAQQYASTHQAYTQHRQRLNDINASLADHAAVQNAQNRVNIHQRQLAKYDPATRHTHAYSQLETMLQNLQQSHAQLGGRQLNWDMAELLKQYNVNNAFKQGGSINRNKINKFLNYAKG